MEFTSTNVIIEILLALLTVMIGVGSFIGASRANKTSAEAARAAVDQKAYERAQGIYESAIQALEGQLEVEQKRVEKLEKRVATLEDQIQALATTNDSLTLELRKLKGSNVSLNYEIERLRVANNKREDEV